jgi:phosphohistidine phosphatase SixA
VLLVGHEPNLSTLAALLCGGRDGLGLSRGEAMRITGGRARWRFAWDAEAPVPTR